MNDILTNPPPRDPVWVGLSLDRAARTLTIACVYVGKDKARCEEMVRERCPGAAALAVDVLRPVPQVLTAARAWLAEQDVLGADNRRLADDLRLALADLFGRALAERRVQEWERERTREAR